LGAFLVNVVYDVFTSLQFINRFTGIHDEDYHWVITVPAIWTDGAKQFMREAAEMKDMVLYCLYYFDLALVNNLIIDVRLT